MAVLIAPQADEAVQSAADPSALQRGRIRPHVQTLSRLMLDPLPPDVREAECTVAVLFRGSLVLNFITGGRADMTFSARCHRARLTGRGRTERIVWTTLALGIDTACAVLRGERDHCAVAWDNYRIRVNGRRVCHTTSTLEANTLEASRALPQTC